MILKATLQKGGSFTDHRGTLDFVNENTPGHYRRFYIITHPDTKVVRAWQGHQFEEKGFYALGGSFVIAVVEPVNFKNPGENETPMIFYISAENKNFLRVPGGHYTGIKALPPTSRLLVLSSTDLSESKSDDYRLPAERWINWDTVDTKNHSIEI